MIVFPFHFGTYKFHGGKFASQVGFTAFPLIGRVGSCEQQGIPFFIDSIVNPFDGKRCFQRNKSFLESDFLKEGFVDFDGCQRLRLQEKAFGSISGCFRKKSIKTGSRAFESAEIYPHRENPISFLQRYRDAHLRTPCCRK